MCVYELHTFSSPSCNSCRLHGAPPRSSILLLLARVDNHCTATCWIKSSLLFSFFQGKQILSCCWPRVDSASLSRSSSLHATRRPPWPTCRYLRYTQGRLVIQTIKTQTIWGKPDDSLYPLVFAEEENHLGVSLKRSTKNCKISFDLYVLDQISDQLAVGSSTPSF